MPTIDADAHVIETELTWEYMEGSEAPFKPVNVTTSSAPGRQFWLIDGKVFGRGGNVGQEFPEASREMKDVEIRLRHMDELGVDVQVLFPSLFLRPLTRRPEVERALARSYNRWMIDVCKKGEKRLHWAAIVPMINMENALAEVKWAKENGACGLFTRPIPEDRVLTDPYFYPLYEEASRLNIPVCVHAGTGSFEWVNVFEQETGFGKNKLPVVSSFHSIVYDGLMNRFPKLKFGFIEVSAQWVPYAIHDIAKRFKRRERNLSPNFMKEMRLYVACQTDDDLDYVLKYTGEDNVVLGSDYGHADTATEIDALRSLQKKGEVSSGAIDKILNSNPTTLFDL
ncbi:MAG: amidohydrolase family protein [Deltaproteobacteria bacterium]|nr:amidohydrolase family protein [Deltaproteobacteria bacterium]